MQGNLNSVAHALYLPPSSCSSLLPLPPPLPHTNPLAHCLFASPITRVTTSSSTHPHPHTFYYARPYLRQPTNSQWTKPRQPSVVSCKYAVVHTYGSLLPQSTNSDELYTFLADVESGCVYHHPLTVFPQRLTTRDFAISTTLD